MFKHTRPASLLLLAAWLALAGCYPPSVRTPAAPTLASAKQGLTGAPEKVVLGLGYIPSVQFAPFYVAQAKGYFAEQGLDVQFQHGFETDFLKLVATDAIPFLIGSGDQVILGRAQGLPVTYVAAWYRQFPVAVFAPQERGLRTPADLEGQRVGISGLFGASLVAWKALVYAAGLDESKITLETIGFTQAAAVNEGRVDAALDYIVNGPVQLRLAGQPVDVIAVSDYIDLPSNGLITNEKTIAERPELVQKMVTAMLRAVRYTLDNPDEAFALSLQAVPEAGGDNTAVNRAIFDASLDLWRASAEELGRSDPDAWQEAAAFMRQMGLVDSEVPVEGIFTNQFVEASQQ